MLRSFCAPKDMLRCVKYDTKRQTITNQQVSEALNSQLQLTLVRGIMALLAVETLTLGESASRPLHHRS